MLPHDEIGSGPAVVLLHAGIADRTMWSERLERLVDAGYRAVAVDLPGFGEAQITPGEQAPWADVLRTMDELSIERAALVGNSFGGAVALRVALVAPDRVSALALISAPPPALEPSPELESAWEAEEAALQRGDIEAAVAAVVDAWTLPDASPELRDRVAVMQRRAFALQAEAPPTMEAPDPVEQRPETLPRLRPYARGGGRAGQARLPAGGRGDGPNAAPCAPRRHQRRWSPRTARNAGGLPQAGARLSALSIVPRHLDRR